MTVARRLARKWRFVRAIALTVTVVMGGTLGFGTFASHQLSAKIHFHDLAVVGESTNEGLSPSQPPSTQIITPPQVRKAIPGTFNIALIGSDARPGQKVSHSDTIVLVHVDLNQHVYNMISLPRDARTYFPGYGYTKLTTIQYMNQTKYGLVKGIEKTVATLSDVTHIPINYYAETNFWGLQDMVDAVGGIDIDLPFAIRLTYPWHSNMQGQVFAKGQHSLNGTQTIEVVRERDSVPGGDYGRQLIQERALIGIAKQVMRPANLSHLPSLSKALPNFLLATNLSAEDLLSLALNLRGDFQPETQIHYFQIPSVNQYVEDDVLKAPNDELLLNQRKLRAVVEENFLNPSATKTSRGTIKETPRETTTASSQRDFGPLGQPRTSPSS